MNMICKVSLLEVAFQTVDQVRRASVLEFTTFVSKLTHDAA
ncbi:MAG: hypothetical protein QOG58_1835, partial [Caballeronia sp.]|nr:hypothetical protein [Caballeronia sp.]